MKANGTSVVVLALVVAFACWAPCATAQRGRGGPGLSPEKAEAAWKLEAECVAKRLALATKETEGLVKAYGAARKSHQEAMEKLAAEAGEDRRARFEAYRELTKKERGKLTEALKGLLKEDQIAQAMASLGTFDRRWDRYVDLLAAFELGDEKLSKALALVEQSVIESNKARREAMATQDWESMRETRRTLKEKLDTALAEVLSEEQQAKWSEATAHRGRGR